MRLDGEGKQKFFLFFASFIPQFILQPKTLSALRRFFLFFLSAAVIVVVVVVAVAIVVFR